MKDNNDRPGRTVKYVYSILVSTSLLLFGWCYYRNMTCGYDCGLFSTGVGPAVVVVQLLSLVVLTLSVCGFLITWLLGGCDSCQT